MTRLETIFSSCRAATRGALSVYIPAGYPDVKTSEAHIRAAIDGGADFVEVGIPFSDPAADGPVIQKATSAAIRAGVKVDSILEMVSRLRADFPDVGLVCMTYANIAYKIGWQRFSEKLAAAGFDGAILADIPLEESQPIRSALMAQNLDWIPLVAPTTTPERMKKICATASGFVYVVSNVGTTGQADPGPLVEQAVTNARAATQMPLVVGFGIATPQDVARVLAAGADGAIVGSALVSKLLSSGTPEGTRAFVATLAQATKL